MSTTPTTDLNSLAMTLYVSSMEHGGNGDLQIDFGALTETEQDYWLTLATCARDSLLPDDWRDRQEEAAQNRDALERIEVLLQSVGAVTDERWLSDVLERLLQSRPITLEHSGTSRPTDATVLPPRITEAVAGLLVGAREAGGIRLSVQLGSGEPERAAREAAQARLDDLAERVRQTDRCGFRTNGYACINERRDFENPAWTGCGTADCPHRGGQG